MSLSDLGAAVRWLREHTEPAAGLPAGGLRNNGRRVRGLRREELAELAGVSAEPDVERPHQRERLVIAAGALLRKHLRLGPARPDPHR